MSPRKMSRSFLLLVLVVGYGSLIAAAPNKKKKPKKKENITVIDPTLESNSKVSSTPIVGSDQDIQIPAALSTASLARPALASEKKSQKWVQPELSQEKLAPIDLNGLRKLLDSQQIPEALVLIELWLALRHDLHTGESLRLNLIKAKLLHYLGRFSEAEESILFSQKYFTLATEGLTAPEDRKRVADLKSFVDLSSFEVFEGYVQESAAK
jgi:hypothetical protein